MEKEFSSERILLKLRQQESLFKYHDWTNEDLDKKLRYEEIAIINL